MPTLTWTHGLFALVLGAEGLQRIVELLVSKARKSDRATDGVKPVGETAWLFMVLTHALLFILPPLELLLFERAFSWTVAGPALVLLVGAKFMRYWALSTLGKAWNARVLKPNHVVQEGPYRFIRHPNYLVVITELMVVPLIHTCWLSSLFLTVLNGAVLNARIRTEEEMLFTLPGYKEAMGNKARFIPGLI